MTDRELQDYVGILKRNLARTKQLKDRLEAKHKGNEHNYSYWGGFDLGYFKGKISQIEDMLDVLDEGWEEENGQQSQTT